jgi:hypothetical protein
VQKSIFTSHNNKKFMKQKHTLEKILIIISLDTVIVTLFLLYSIFYRAPIPQYKIEQTIQEKEEKMSAQDLLKYKISSSISSQYSEEISKAVYYQNQKTGIPIYIIMSLIDTESEFVSSADSFIDASNGRGLTQISEIALYEYNRYHKNKYTSQDLYSIDINLEIGCWMLLQVKKVYPKIVGIEQLSWNDAYIAYNVGWSNYTNYKKDYYNGYDVVHHKSYRALNRWKSKLSYWSTKFTY